MYGANPSCVDYGGDRILTPKQQELVSLVASGLKNKSIAEIVGTTEQVIKNYLRPIFDKTGMSTRLELALWWLERQREVA